MKRIIILLLALLFIASIDSFPALGQVGSITLKSSEVRGQFPDGVAFTATAETVAPDTVQEIKLDMKVKGSARGAYAYLEFTPGTMVTGQYLLRTSGAQYKPPGSLIEYRFIIRDSAGRSLETPPETFLYMDNRFEWAKVAQGMVEVYYYGSARGRAELIVKASVEAVTKMGGLLGVAPGQTIRIIGYNSPADMASALPYQGKAVQTELLTQGMAWYEYSVLLELIVDPRADGVAGHEITHMLVREAATGAFVNLPAWLNEGLAEYGNANPGYSFDAILAEAIASGKLLPLRHMQGVPGIPRDILLFYGQARSAVRYMVDSYGGDKLRGLFAAFRDGLPIDGALKKVYGFDQDGLDNAWRASLGLPPVEPAPALTPPSSSGRPLTPTQEPSRPPAVAKRGLGCAAPAAR